MFLLGRPGMTNTREVGLWMRIFVELVIETRNRVTQKKGN